MDPRNAKTLEEACMNLDGTYDGFKLVSFLRNMPVEDVKRWLLSEAAKRRDEH